MDMDWDEKLEPTTQTIPYKDEKTGLVLNAEVATLTFTPEHPELSTKVERVQINDSDGNVEKYLNRARSKVTNEWLGELGLDTKSSWFDQNTKKIYIDNFKRHLALNIASMMQGYSDQTYELTKSKYDQKNQVTLIDMEIFSDTGSVVVTWRVKESKDRFFVIDLIVADISLVVTKRSEFNSMLKKVDNDLSKFNEVLSDQNEISYLKITE